MFDPDSLSDYAFRQTRSKHVFSPWAKITPPATAHDFDFPSLVAKAIARDDLLHDSSLETPSPFSSPLTSPELEPLELEPLELEPIDDDPPSPRILSLDANAEANRPKSHPTQISTQLPNLSNLTAKQRQKSKLTERRKLRRRATHLEASRTRKPGSNHVRPKSLKKHVVPAAPCPVDFNAHELRHTRFGWTGKTDISHKKVFALQELVGPQSKFNFTLETWNGKDAIPITDRDDRVIAVLAGSPDDVTWSDVHVQAAEALESSRKILHAPTTRRRQRRGEYCAESVGVSMGGGQKVPGTLRCADAQVMAFLLGHIAFIRLAGFASHAFAMWAPLLYGYYSTQLTAFYSHYPSTVRNFFNSVFACCTFNFGPMTCCFDHTDPGNLPFGWCAITALGKFNPKLGGHLILWDLHLVIEFPPGSTILLPSASIRHGNSSIQNNETRYSFTQYTAGGIFRWVDQGFQKTTEWRQKLNKEEKGNEKKMGAERWTMGVGLFSKLSSLQASSI